METLFRDRAASARCRAADAEIPDADVTVETLDDGKTVVSAMVEDAKLDAAAAILDSGASASVEDRSDLPDQTVDGRPDEDAPVAIPLVPNR
ncbi:hypothetical protein [Neoaquamicrobium sediminum]|uniref:BON domain-containing protein n=1 Tax=Neoaquamicrobium sediminum TaxID=1849104 RepID=A0ABV3X0K1_9HYPH